MSCQNTIFSVAFHLTIHQCGKIDYLAAQDCSLAESIYFPRSYWNGGDNNTQDVVWPPLSWVSSSFCCNPWIWFSLSMHDGLVWFLAAAMPMLVVIAGVLGGVILTVAVIMIVILCRRNSKKFQNLEKQDLRIKIEKQKRTEPKEEMGLSPPVSTVTSSDGVSNNSSDIKVEGRTGSSLSEGDNHHVDDWEGSDDSFRPTAAGTLTTTMSRGKTLDYVDGLPRAFEVSNGHRL